MSKKTLAWWLQKDYEIRGKKVYSKTKYKIEYNNKVYELPENYVWILGNSRRGSDEIESCQPIITYAGVLALQKEFSIDLSGVEFIENIVRDHPAGYTVTVRANGGCLPVPVIGEASLGNVQKSMESYVFTIAWKRAIARSILQVTGLYSQGFYSDAELGGDFGIQEVDVQPPKNKTIDKEEKEEVRGDIAKNIMGSMYDEVKKMLQKNGVSQRVIDSGMPILAKYFKKDKHKNIIHFFNSFIKYSSDEIKQEVGKEITSVIKHKTKNVDELPVTESEEPLSAYTEAMAKKYFKEVLPDLYEIMDDVFFTMFSVNVTNYYKTKDMLIFHFSDAGIFISNLAKYCDTNPRKLIKALMTCKSVDNNGLIKHTKLNAEIKQMQG